MIQARIDIFAEMAGHKIKTAVITIKFIGFIDVAAKATRWLIGFAAGTEEQKIFGTVGAEIKHQIFNGEGFFAVTITDIANIVICFALRRIIGIAAAGAESTNENNENQSKKSLIAYSALHVSTSLHITQKGYGAAEDAQALQLVANVHKGFIPGVFRLQHQLAGGFIDAL